MLEENKPDEEIEFLQLGDKERGDRLEAMVDRMSETIVNLKSELAEYKELYNSVAQKLNAANHLLSDISQMLVHGREGGRTLLAPDGLTAAQISEVEGIVRKLITGKA